MSTKKLTEDKGFLKRLNTLIDELGMTQKEFAQTISISEGYLSYIRSGKRNISAQAIIGIATHFSDRFNWLLTGKDAIPPSKGSLNAGSGNLPKNDELKKMTKSLKKIHKKGGPRLEIVRNLLKEFDKN